MVEEGIAAPFRARRCQSGRNHQRNLKRRHVAGGEASNAPPLPQRCYRRGVAGVGRATAVAALPFCLRTHRSDRTAPLSARTVRSKEPVRSRPNPPEDVRVQDRAARAGSVPYMRCAPSSMSTLLSSGHREEERAAGGMADPCYPSRRSYGTPPRRQPEHPGSSRNCGLPCQWRSGQPATGAHSLRTLKRTYGGPRAGACAPKDVPRVRQIRSLRRTAIIDMDHRASAR